LDSCSFDLAQDKFRRNDPAPNDPAKEMRGQAAKAYFVRGKQRPELEAEYG